MLACGWCKPPQASRISLAGETLFIALATGRLRLIALDLASAAGPTTRERFRSLPRPSFGGYGIRGTTLPRTHSCKH